MIGDCLCPYSIEVMSHKPGQGRFEQSSLRKLTGCSKLGRLHYWLCCFTRSRTIGRQHQNSEDLGYLGWCRLSFTNSIPRQTINKATGANTFQHKRHRTLLQQKWPSDFNGFATLQKHVPRNAFTRRWAMIVSHFAPPVGG